MADQALQERMKAWVGRTGDAQVARDPVNEPTIRRWVDAFEDDNPCYVDDGFAARSVHGGIVAPPAMLAVWDQRGRRAVRRPGPLRLLSSKSPSRDGSGGSRSS